MINKELKLVFSEICGIHAGDGWLSSLTNEVGFGTALKEEQYFNEVKNLYSRIFDMHYLRVLRRKALEFRFQSKEAQQILLSAGFPKGKKIERKLYRISLIRKKDITRYLLEIGFRNNRRWFQVLKKKSELEKYNLL